MSEQTSSTPGEAPAEAEAAGVNGAAAEAAAEAPAATASESGGGASTADLVGLIEEMAKRFLPDKAVGKNAVIQYDITTLDGTHTYQVVVAGGTCTTGPGAGQEASVTLALSAPDFLRLISGKLNGMTAFMSGKLKLKGDMMLAQTMQGWFDHS